MLSLKDFKISEVATNKILGGSGDPNVTPGGSHTYSAPYYPGGSATGTWSSDYRGLGGSIEYCDLKWRYGN